MTFGGGFGQAASSLWTSASVFRNGGDHYDPHFVQLLCKQRLCVFRWIAEGQALRMGFSLYFWGVLVAGSIS